MTNKWWELQILCEPNLEDSVFWRLEKFGVKGTASEKKEQSCFIRAYLHKNQVELLDLAALSLWLRQDALLVSLPTPILQWQLIDEEDWASSWKQHWQPQEIGDRFLIYPAWLPLPEKSDRLLLRLDPGTAFGTGNHMTTQLCLEALEMRLDETSNDLVIADIGCGSGILSIGALLLGASKVYAVDIDPLAINATHSNSQLNQIAASNLVVELGSIEQLKQVIEQPLDGFVCNILAEVIIDLIPHFNQITKPKAWGILSGILLSQSQAIADTLEQNGWIVAALWRRKDWCCFNIRRN